MDSSKRHIFQQHHHHDNQNNNIPSPIILHQPPSNPHTMCTPHETNDRQCHLELHPFECTTQTYTLTPRHRVANSKLVVKKYRRSAAGGGVIREDDGQQRNLIDLDVTVAYLLGYLLPRQTVYKPQIMKPWSLADTVQFVDDRLRAVQVDLTTLLGSVVMSKERRRVVRKMQARMVRYNILIQYLLFGLEDVSKYERKFGLQALRTALSAFLDVQEGEEDEKEDVEVKDEILSYAALLHIATILRTNETALPPVAAGSGFLLDEGAGYTALLALHRRHCCRRSANGVGGEGGGGDDGNGSKKRTPPPSSPPSSSSVEIEPPELVEEWISNEGKKLSLMSSSGQVGKGRVEEQYPKYKFALEIAALADTGNYNRLLRLLESEGMDLTSALKEEQGCNLRRWKIFCRLCLSSALNVIRIGAMRQYNKSFGKKEMVSGSDLARLLHLQTSQSAINFCVSIGLPTSSADDDVGGVIMKAAPISITGSDNINRITTPTRIEEDAYIFGMEYYATWREVRDLSCRPKGGSGDDTVEAKRVVNKRREEEVAAPTTKRATENQKNLVKVTTTTTKVVNNPNHQHEGRRRRWGDESDSDSDSDDWAKADVNVTIEAVTLPVVTASTGPRPRWGDDSESDNDDDDDWPKANNATKEEEDDSAGGVVNAVIRLDEDGIIIPPADVIWYLLR